MFVEESEPRVGSSYTHVGIVLDVSCLFTSAVALLTLAFTVTVSVVTLAYTLTFGWVTPIVLVATFGKGVV